MSDDNTNLPVWYKKSVLDVDAIIFDNSQVMIQMLGVNYHTVTEDAFGLQTVLDANRQDLQHGAIGELIYKLLVILMFPNERKGSEVL